MIVLRGHACPRKLQPPSPCRITLVDGSELWPLMPSSAALASGTAKPKPAPVSRPTHLRRARRTDAHGRPYRRRMGAHDQWLAESCEHEGFILSFFLGNITKVGNLRSFLRHLQGKPGPRFPILLEKVLYDGTHTGDWILRQTVAGTVERGQYRPPLQRYSGRVREGILHQHEASLRGQYCDREPDYVLSHGFTRINTDLFFSLPIRGDPCKSVANRFRGFS